VKARKEATVTQELAARTTVDGERVTLLWYRRSGRVAVEVAAGGGHCARTARAFVAPAQAFDAFLHPFVHVDPALVAG
jgi:hypothetical protein